MALNTCLLFASAIFAFVGVAVFLVGPISNGGI